MNLGNNQDHPVMQMEKHIWDLSAQFGFDTNTRVFKGMLLF